MKYDFEFSWDSTYGHAARLAAEHAERGLVVDLGCGAAALSVPLHELGFEYHGFDHDPDAIELCRERGIRCDPIDLRDADEAVGSVLAGVGARRVSVVALLDVIEHLVDPGETFAALRRLAVELSSDGRAPLFVVSIPNVAHFDLGAKLVAGRWDVTDVGLLDSTHVTLFTEERIARMFTAAGFVEHGRDDMVLDHTEQSFPADHPAVARGTPLELLLRDVRDRADANGDVYQFVRCYRFVGSAPVDNTGSTVDPDDDRSEVLCSVVVRSTGRVADLEDVLTCLAAQRDRDLEVVVALDGATVPVRAAVVETVAAFAPAFRERVRVVEAGAGRVDLVGRYVAVLDESDLVTGDWATELRVAAESARGRTIRVRSTTQPCGRHPVDGRLAPLDGFTPATTPVFNLIGHLAENQTPPGSWATPRAAVDAIGLDVFAAPDAVADWAMMVRLAAWTGVDDRSRVCHVRRVTGVAEPPDPVAVTELLDRSPLVLPPGGAGAVADLLAQGPARHRAEEAYVGAMARIDALERSRYWRATSPVRRVVARARSVRTRARDRIGR